MDTPQRGVHATPAEQRTPASCTSKTQPESIHIGLGKGDRVLIVGNVLTDSWNDKDTGDKRTAQRILVDAAGPSLRWATARVHKAQRTTTEPGEAGQTD